MKNYWIEKKKNEAGQITEIMIGNEKKVFDPGIKITLDDADYFRNQLFKALNLSEVFKKCYEYEDLK